MQLPSHSVAGAVEIRCKLRMEDCYFVYVWAVTLRLRACLAAIAELGRMMAHFAEWGRASADKSGRGDANGLLCGSFGSWECN